MPADEKYFEIKQYKVSFRKTVLTINGENYNRVALINCMGPNQSTDIIKFININFLETDADVPENTITAVNNQYNTNLFHKAEYYAWFIDLLRNEKPIFLQYSISQPSRNSIKSGSEPIGEDE